MNLMIENRTIFSSRRKRQPVLKLSTFCPKFNDNQSNINNQVNKFTQHKRLIYSSYMSNRFTSDSNNITFKTIHTSYHHKNYQQIEGKINFNSTQKKYKQQILPSVTQNIKELKDLMKEKIAAIKQIKTTQENLYNFSQYKIKGLERDRWNLSTLHSRKIAQSPFTKSVKQKKQAISTRYYQNQTISAKSGKRQKSKKMILIGGSIPVRAIATNPQNQPSFSPLKSARKHLKLNNFQQIRRNHQFRGIRTTQRYVNDFQPWQVHKGQGLQQSSNIYLYQR